MSIPAHTYKNQDGVLVNPMRRWKKNKTKLVNSFSLVEDGRSTRGRRHSLPLILSIMFLGMTAGYSTLKDCLAYASSHLKLLLSKTSKTLPLHGLPCETAISRALAKVSPESLDKVMQTWLDLLFAPTSSSISSQQLSQWASFDGKTMRGVGIGKEAGDRHILSLTSHLSHRILGQEGVNSKENEIPAAKRLFSRLSLNISDLTLVGDALHTQTDVARVIVEQKADYFLFVKGNQKTLHSIIKHTFTDPLTKTTTATDRQVDSHRDITSTFTLTKDLDLKDLEKDWLGINWVGMIHRVGSREEKGVIKQVDETVYVICSRTKLTAEEGLLACRNHWGIENNLHWQKDWTWREDQQKISRGKAPQIITYLRSLTITLGHYLQTTSITDMVKTNQMQEKEHKLFLKKIAFN